MFSLIYAWINGWVNNRGAGDLRRHLAHYDVSVMCLHLQHYESESESDLFVQNSNRHTVTPNHQEPGL